MGAISLWGFMNEWIITDAIVLNVQHIISFEITQGKAGVLYYLTVNTIDNKSFELYYGETSDDVVKKLQKIMLWLESKKACLIL